MTFETFAQTYGSHSFINQDKGFLEREVEIEEVVKSNTVDKDGNIVVVKRKVIKHTTKHFHLEKDGTLHLYTFTGEQGKEVVTVGEALTRADFKDTSVYDAMLAELEEVAATMNPEQPVVETVEISPTEALK